MISHKKNAIENIFKIIKTIVKIFYTLQCI